VIFADGVILLKGSRGRRIGPYRRGEVASRPEAARGRGHSGWIAIRGGPVARGPRDALLLLGPPEADGEIAGTQSRSSGDAQKSPAVACLACKHVANIQDIIRGHRMGPVGMTGPADLHRKAPCGTRSHPTTRPSPNFKIVERVQTRWRVRFPSASATRAFGSFWDEILRRIGRPAGLKNRCRSLRKTRAAPRNIARPCGRSLLLRADRIVCRPATTRQGRNPGHHADTHAAARLGETSPQLRRPSTTADGYQSSSPVPGSVRVTATMTPGSRL
jgi:hypothetical protein